MTSKGKLRAANALMNARCGVGSDKFYFRMAYVVGDSPFLFFNAAKRQQRWLETENEVCHRWFGNELKKFEIEIMTIQEAWRITHCEEMPSCERKHINDRINQTGD